MTAVSEFLIETLSHYKGLYGEAMAIRQHEPCSAASEIHLVLSIRGVGDSHLWTGSKAEFDEALGELAESKWADLFVQGGLLEQPELHW